MTLEWFEGLDRDQLKAVIEKNIRYQQNLVIRTITLVMPGNPQWPVLGHHVDRVVAAVNAARPGTYVVVENPEA